MPVRRGVSAAVAAVAVVAVAAGGAGAQEDAVVRIAAVSPAQPRAGEPLTIDLTSTSDDAVRVCLLPGAGRSRCAMAAAGADGVHHVTLTAPYTGRWTVVADAGAERLTEDLLVRPRGDRLVVLATGDSLVQNLAHGLAGRLRLRRDVVLHRSIQMGRGLSKPDRFDWVADAQEAAARLDPDVVVVFLGGNEGYDMGGAGCCAAPWVARFAQRQRALMQAYARGGRTRVYWVTLPAPGPSVPARRIVWTAENLALRTAAAEDDARIFDAAAILTPRYEWRRRMRWHGRRRIVRERDEVHLTRAGGRVAGFALLEQLRRDRVLLPARGTRDGFGRNTPRPTRQGP